MAHKKKIPVGVFWDHKFYIAGAPFRGDTAMNIKIGRAARKMLGKPPAKIKILY
jgi:hypothetical protein